MKTSGELVVAFIKQCHSENIHYAIARNYENYPDFDHDLDIFCHPKDYLPLRNLLVSLISSEWDFFSETLSYSGSIFDDQNVNSIKLFNSKNNNFLQVDFFYGLTFGGISHIDIEYILGTRKLDDSRQFYRISKHLEMYYRTFQIASRYFYEGESSKVVSYAQHWLNFFSDKTQFDYQLSLLSKKDIGLLQKYLRSGSYNNFARYVRSKKIQFIFKSFIKSPVTMFKRVSERCTGLVREYLTMYSGVNIFYSNVISVECEDQLDLLTQIKVIPGWAYKKDLSFFERVKLRERGGVVLVKKKNASNQYGMNKSNIQHLVLSKIFR